MLLFTNFFEGDIGHVSNELLVLCNVFSLDNDGVGDVAVPAPANEGLPVPVQLTVVHLLTNLLAPVHDHFGKVRKAYTPIIGPEHLGSISFVRMVNDFVLVC